MKKEKIYSLEVLLILFLLFALFASNSTNRWFLAIGMLAFLGATLFLVKEKKIRTLHEKQVTILLLLFSGIYIAGFYLLGIYYGYVENKYLLSISNFFMIVLPLAITIISTEMIRNRLISQDIKLRWKTKKIELSLIFVYIATILIDLKIYASIYDLGTLGDFLKVLGYALFAALSNNLLFNYLTRRYGTRPVLIYRLITVLFLYIFPILPNVYIFLRSFLRMIYPFIIYGIIEKRYQSKESASYYKNARTEWIGNTAFITVLVLIIMLISCQFRYGIIVVGSRSMTGTVNKGDAILFERYDGQPIEQGQVIIYHDEDVKIIHRVVEMRRVNGEMRYYTQGDANSKRDDDYRVESDIDGLVRNRIKYLGVPTLWVRSLFRE